ncbi:TetR/AcrR family transcriptional regulator [Candidatus Poribacteria bacterium]
MKSKDSSKSKIRILQAAEKLFAEKGFDAARVDDIAEKAGVNKALIYYYFKSKRDVLDQLFNNLVEELLKVVHDSLEQHANFESVEDMAQELGAYYDFMESKEDTIRIMMMESLKGSEGSPPLFKLSELTTGEAGEEIMKMFEERGISVDVDMDEARIGDFFTGMIPMLNFIVYRHDWSKHFGIDPAELKQKFFRIFRITHLAYHKVQQEEME